MHPLSVRVAAKDVPPRHVRGMPGVVGLRCSLSVSWEAGQVTSSLIKGSVKAVWTFPREMPPRGHVIDVGAANFTARGL